MPANASFILDIGKVQIVENRTRSFATGRRLQWAHITLSFTIYFKVSNSSLGTSTKGLRCHCRRAAFVLDGPQDTTTAKFRDEDVLYYIGLNMVAR